MIVHGERGELIGKTRDEAKNGPSYDWNDDSNVDNDSHLKDSITVDLSAGGPKAATRDGYLRLKSGNSIGCSRIESNYYMPDREGVTEGYSKGGAFVVCTNVLSDPTMDATFGEATATLAADNKSGDAYMIVTNPRNNRKAVAYGNYGNSFYNSYKNAYNGGAIETMNNSNNVATLLAAEVEQGADGADKGENHKKSSVMNLNDSNESLKLQVRADEEGGYIHAYDNNEDKPTVTLAGSKNDAEDRSYSVVARRKDRGSVKLQADYNDDDANKSGAAILRKESNNYELAVMSSDVADAGYFVLKESENEKFKAMSNDGGAMYFGNVNNTSALNSGSNSNKTVSIESIHDGSTGGHMEIKTASGDGSLEIASNKNDNDSDTGAAIYAKNSNDRDTVKLHANTRGDAGSTKGGGLILSNYGSDGKESKAELLSSSGLEGSGNGGTLALYHGSSKPTVIASAKGPNSSGWLSIRSEKDERGVDVYGDYNNGAAVLLTPKKSVSSNSNIAKNASTVEMFGRGQYDSSKFESPVVNVRGVDNRASSVSVYGDISKSNSNLAGIANKSGGIVTRNTSGVENAYLMGDSKYGTGGYARFGNSGNKVQAYSNRFGAGAGLDVGTSFKIHSNSGGESLIEANNVQASARIKVGSGGISAKEAESLIVNADSYHGFSGSNIRKFIFSAIEPNMPALASRNKSIGHTQCIKELKNCPDYYYDSHGVKVYTGEYLGADPSEKWGRNEDVYTGRMHDYSLYSAGIGPDNENYHLKSARHVGRYDLIKKPSDYGKEYTLTGAIGSFLSDLLNGNLTTDDNHDIKGRWHDNSTGLRDRGRWSKRSHAIQKGMDFPDQIPPSWNIDNYNY